MDLLYCQKFLQETYPNTGTMMFLIVMMTDGIPIIIYVAYVQISKNNPNLGV